jgi:hypothetical protein
MKLLSNFVRANPDNDDEFVIIENEEQIGMLAAHQPDGNLGKLTWFTANNNGCAKGPYDSFEQALEEFKGA